MRTRLLLLSLIILIHVLAHAAPPAGYTLVFSDEFKEPLSCSNWGPGTKWIANTPYNGNFGVAAFGYWPNRLYTNNGVLVMMDYFDTSKNRWLGCLLSSMDTKANGFAQALGYWECAIRWHGELDTWPGFWLASANGILPHANNTAEIDILEAYGSQPSVAHQVLHVWNGSGGQVYASGHVQSWNLTNFTHVYGCLVNKDFIHYYIDGYEIWTVPTPPEATLPLYCMIDFAMYSTSGAISPSFMYVDYVRCYAPPNL